MEGAKNRAGHIYARGLVELAVTGAIAFHQALMEITRLALVTSTSKLIIKSANVHNRLFHFYKLFDLILRNNNIE